jgi:hypothetical protein
MRLQARQEVQSTSVNLGDLLEVFLEVYTIHLQRQRKIRSLTREASREGFVASLLCDCALSFSLNSFSIAKGKVCPFSQISTSFLIFSCEVGKRM